jgi:hypothetical protein
VVGEKDPPRADTHRLVRMGDDKRSWPPACLRQPTLASHWRHRFRFQRFRKLSAARAGVGSRQRRPLLLLAVQSRPKRRFARSCDIASPVP